MPTVYDCLADEPIKYCDTMGEAVELQKAKGGEKKCVYVFTSTVKCAIVKESGNATFFSGERNQSKPIAGREVYHEEVAASPTNNDDFRLSLF